MLLIITISGSHRYQQISDLMISDIKWFGAICGLCAGDDSGSDGVGENHSAEMSAVLRESARPAGESSTAHAPRFQRHVLILQLQLIDTLLSPRERSRRRTW